MLEKSGARPLRRADVVAGRSLARAATLDISIAEPHPMPRPAIAPPAATVSRSHDEDSFCRAGSAPLRCCRRRDLGGARADACRPPARRGDRRARLPARSPARPVQRQKGRVAADRGAGETAAEPHRIGRPRQTARRADARLYRGAGRGACGAFERRGESEATVAVDVADEAPVAAGDAAAALAFGAPLRSYRFDKYKTKQKPEQKRSLAQLTLSTDIRRIRRSAPIARSSKPRRRCFSPATSCRSPPM